MTLLRTDGKAALPGPVPEGQRGETYKALRELSLEARWALHLEKQKSARHLAGIAKAYLDMGDEGRRMMRAYPPGYYRAPGKRLIFLGRIIDHGGMTQEGVGIEFFHVQEPRRVEGIALGELIWHDHAPPVGERWHFGGAFRR